MHVWVFFVHPDYLQTKTMHMGYGDSEVAVCMHVCLFLCAVMERQPDQVLSFIDRRQAPAPCDPEQEQAGEKQKKWMDLNKR